MSTRFTKTAPPPAAENEFLKGLLAMLPLSLSVIPFALLLGGLGIQKIDQWELLLMSATVFAGAAQLVALNLWTETPAIWAIVGATWIVNLRYFMLTASFTPHIRHFPPWARYLAVGMLADENWAVGMKRALAAPLSVGYVVGASLPFYLNWLLWTQMGGLIGGLIEQPERYGLDFVYTAVFIVLMSGFVKGHRGWTAIAVSSAVALLVYKALPGVWYILAGGLAGGLSGLFTRGRGRISHA